MIGNRLSEISATDEHAPLTVREIEVLSLVASGATSKEIAEGLSLTVSGVDFHLRNVMGKLDARNRAHAVAKAVAQGFITVL
ncbi:MAG: helix-turn-helix transcriptional regulator [Alphaproteobacteria bacterium]|nr:helix-turn-helix transcriptional regulator [Alphaproteobacteria bacterium]